MLSFIKRLRKLQTEQRRKSSAKDELLKREFIKEKVLSSETTFQVREAYKTLRTNVIFSLPQEGCKRICVTSSIASEGKSTNCLNLAITFAETGAKVLIIDCDLRRPNISRLLDKKGTPGLSNALVGLNSLEEVINDSGYTNLDVIFSGSIPPNPAELLGSDRMGEIIEELSKKYDYIFFDTAPVNIVTDTAIIAKWMSGVIMIVLYNSTDKDTIEEALKQLDFANAKILGFVLNGVVYGSNGSYKYNYKRYTYKDKRYAGDYRRGRYGRYGHYSHYGHDKHHSSESGSENKASASGKKAK